MLQAQKAYVVAQLVRVLLIFGAALFALVGIVVLAGILLVLGVLGLSVELLSIDDLVILVLGIASVVLDDTLLLKKTHKRT
jgi:hypothetical protein